MPARPPLRRACTSYSIYARQAAPEVAPDTASAAPPAVSDVTGAGGEGLGMDVGASSEDGMWTSPAATSTESLAAAPSAGADVSAPASSEDGAVFESTAAPVAGVVLTTALSASQAPSPSPTPTSSLPLTIASDTPTLSTSLPEQLDPTPLSTFLPEQPEPSTVLVQPALYPVSVALPIPVPVPEVLTTLLPLTVPTLITQTTLLGISLSEAPSPAQSSFSLPPPPPGWSTRPAFISPAPVSEDPDTRPFSRNVTLIVLLSLAGLIALFSLFTYVGFLVRRTSRTGSAFFCGARRDKCWTEMGYDEAAAEITRQDTIRRRQSEDAATVAGRASISVSRAPSRASFSSRYSVPFPTTPMHDAVPWGAPVLPPHPEADPFADPPPTSAGPAWEYEDDDKTIRQSRMFADMGGGGAQPVRLTEEGSGKEVGEVKTEREKEVEEEARASRVLEERRSRVLGGKRESWV